MPDPTTTALVRQLLAYTHANPDASDSAQGIARWWLDSTEEVDVQALGNALELLVAAGVFAERIAADGRRSYRRVGSDAQLAALLTSISSGPAPAGMGGTEP